MKKPEVRQREKFDLKFRPRETETVSMNIPKDALDSLKQVAADRDMSVQALLKFYIGQGLRQDVARFAYFSDRERHNDRQIL